MGERGRGSEREAQERGRTSEIQLPRLPLWPLLLHTSLSSCFSAKGCSLSQHSVVTDCSIGANPIFSENRIMFLEQRDNFFRCRMFLNKNTKKSCCEQLLYNQSLKYVPPMYLSWLLRYLTLMLVCSPTAFCNPNLVGLIWNQEASLEYFSLSSLTSANIPLKNFSEIYLLTSAILGHSAKTTSPCFSGKIVKIAKDTSCCSYLPPAWPSIAQVLRPQMTKHRKPAILL